MKIILDVDKAKALNLAQELEKTSGINAVAFKYSTKKRILRKD